MWTVEKGLWLREGKCPNASEEALACVKSYIVSAEESLPGNWADRDDLAASEVLVISVLWWGWRACGRI